MSKLNDQEVALQDWIESEKPDPVDIRLKQVRRNYFHVTTSGTTRNPIGSIADPTQLICVGFGNAAILRDGEVVIDGEMAYRDGDLIRLYEAEGLAMNDPGHEWLVELSAPLWDATFKRTAPMRWECISAGEGFA